MRPRAAQRCRVCPQLRPCPVHPEPKRFAQTHAAEYRTPEYRELRRQVLREETHCGICRTPGEVDDQVDHITPLARGGRTVRANLRRAHRRCNLVAGARLGHATQELVRGAR